MFSLIAAGLQTADDMAPITVELTRHERGLLKLQLVPSLLTSARGRHLLIVDLYGTGKAIDDKLQVSQFFISTALQPGNR
jgi:hypothetical protein